MNKTFKKSIYVSLATLSIAGLAGFANGSNVSAKHRRTRSARITKITKRTRRNRRAKRSRKSQRKNVTKRNRAKARKSRKSNKRAKKVNRSSSITGAEQKLARQKFNYANKMAKKSRAYGRALMKADKKQGKPFNRRNYAKEYLYAVSHPSLIKGAQGATGSATTIGATDGLKDYNQYQAMLATKRYAKQHHMSQSWVNKNLNVNNDKTFASWYFTGFQDNAGGNDSDDAKEDAGRKGVIAYKEGLAKASSAKRFKITKGFINYTSHHLSNTIFNTPAF